MMEGISHEACALAGTLGLGKLIALYDDNGISIDSDKGQIKQWYTDDVRKRFEAYGWQVIPDVDGHDVEAVDKAISKAKREKRPGRRLICCKTVIAKGAPKKANTGAAHGAPLGAEEIAATRAAIGWPHPAVRDPRGGLRAAGTRARPASGASASWNKLLKSYETSLSRTMPPSSSAAWRATCRADFDEKLAGTARRLQQQRRNHRHAQGVAERPRSARSRRCRSWSAARPT